MYVRITDEAQSAAMQVGLTPDLLGDLQFLFLQSDDFPPLGAAPLAYNPGPPPSFAFRIEDGTANGGIPVLDVYCFIDPPGTLIIDWIELA